RRPRRPGRRRRATAVVESGDRATPVATRAGDQSHAPPLRPRGANRSRTVDAAAARLTRMDRDAVSRWVDEYERAWREDAPDAVERLFREDAAYRRSPYEP